MDNNMCERLADILDKATGKFCSQRGAGSELSPARFAAKALINAGVILPKFNMGQEVLIIIFTGTWKPYKTFIKKTPSSENYSYLVDFYGHERQLSEANIYLTETEAWEAIKK